MHDLCEMNDCTGCMACADICPRDAITVKIEVDHCAAQIDDTKCIHCNLCEKVCQVHHPVSLMPPVRWHQGWAADAEIRSHASSGGIASAVAAAFVENFGTVYACSLQNGEFGFIPVETKADISRIRGSKYVKSNPGRVYSQIRETLKAGNKALFIGLPCQVGAVKNFVGEKLWENLYTMDLICHGTPPSHLLESYFQKKENNERIPDDLSFRNHTKFGLTTAKKGLLLSNIRDPYMISFLSGISYTENCYHCPYAQSSRTGDISLGDSWDSDLPAEEQVRGISLILVQSAKGEALLESSNVRLLDVDVRRATEANVQLRHPTERPAGRDQFLKLLKNGRSLRYTVWRCFPKQSFKQMVKRILFGIRAGLKKPGDIWL